MPTEIAEPAPRGEVPASVCSRPISACKTGEDRFPWWAWPHLLSLDAPLVAVAWQSWWARSARIELPHHATWILGLGVWAIYVADRLVDTAGGGLEIPTTLRHNFHARWRGSLLPLVLLATAALAVMSFVLLTRAILLKGTFFGLCAGGYFWLIHGRRLRGWQSRVPKEIIVGAVFAIGTVFFPWSHGRLPWPKTALAAALFGGICACNCALITRWERTPQDLADPVSLVNAFPLMIDQLAKISLGLAAAAGLLWLASGASIFAPILISGVTLACLDTRRHRIPVPILRVLADAALLTPLMFWP